MKYDNNFSKCLANSNKSVKEFCAILRKKGYKIINSNNNTNSCDIIAEKDGKKYLFEVKHDLQYKKTGNIYIEYSSRGKKSGLVTTKSDYYVYKLDDDFYGVPTKNLRDYLSNSPSEKYVRKSVKGGDNNTSVGYLVKANLVKKYWQHERLN